MKRSRWVLAVGFVAGLLAACLVVTPFVRDQMLLLTRVVRERNEGADLANKLISTDSLLDYSATHPDQVAIASWDLGDEPNGIFFHAERAQPAAGASALLVLAAYARDADPEAPVTVGQWERYVLPGTDGGAHQAALLELRARGVLRDGGASLFAGASAAEPAASAQTRLDDVVRAMIRHADPAAADLLIEQLGRARLTERVLGLGFAADAVPLPWSGMTLSLLEGGAAPELLARFRAQQRGAYVDATWQRFQSLREDAELRARSVERLERRGIDYSLRETAELAAAFVPRAAAAEYARLLQQVLRGELAGAEYMRTQLQQPLAAGVDEELDSFGALRGSQPGMYASVMYGRARGTNHTRVLALMLRKLPMGVWLHLSSGYLLRKFEGELLGDDAFFRKARARLTPLPGEDLDNGAQTAVDLHNTR